MFDAEASRTTQVQYEKYPYPPIPWFGLPQGEQARQKLSYELFAQKPSDGIRILVAGAGTFEALLVALFHPKASEVIALDWSASALKILKKRIQFFKGTHFFKSKLPPIRLLCGDLCEVLKKKSFRAFPFDYILASNVLHHVSEPASLFHLLSGCLKDQGVLRLVTYPKASRFWMRQTTSFFHSHGLSADSPQLKRRCLEAVDRLPLHHPIRACFLGHPEISRPAGLVDAFFHPLENPLHPFEWAEGARRSQLSLFKESQASHSQSSFLSEVVPELAHLDAWTRLQLLDDLLELCVNPILWFKKEGALGVVEQSFSPFLRGLPSTPPRVSMKEELAWNALRIQIILESVPFSMYSFIKRFQQEVGPRGYPAAVTKKYGLPEKVLGMALSDYF